MSYRFTLYTAFVAVLGLALISTPSIAGLGDTERVSVSSTGTQGNVDSIHAAISADGHYIAFDSLASNLVTGDTNDCNDIFYHNRVSGSTGRVSVSSAGDQGNGISGTIRPAISADGRYVTFNSIAKNLVAGDTNSKQDVFVRNMATRVTERVSVSSSGEQGNDHSADSAISADGRYVAFDSLASNLAPGDTNGDWDVFVHDRVTGATTCVSVSSAGVLGNDLSVCRAISADGRYVVFESYASNLVPGDTNGHEDVFVHDRATGETIRVSVSSAGVQGDLDSWGAAISADGRYVAFQSESPNLVPGDSNGTCDVFLHDRVTGSTERVSLSSSGEQGSGGDSAFPSVSADGRYVAFQSGASNLVPDDTNYALDVYVRDRVTGATERVSLSSAGAQSDSSSGYPAISADGRYVAFFSYATNLVPGDTNGFVDVFVRQYIPDVVQATCPSGWLNPGWNYFSIPLEPTGSAEASTILGFDANNILYRWNPVAKNIELYYSDFKYLDRGRGYLLWLMTTPHPPSYESFAATGDFEIALPEAGWTWIGQPFDHNTVLSTCSIRNNTTGVTRTALQDTFAASPWINWSFLWWDSTADSFDMLTVTGQMNNSLIPWRGYLVWANTRDLTLIVPAE